jgi:hypothetical protein
MELLE